MLPFELVLLGGMFVSATASPVSDRHSDSRQSQVSIGKEGDVPFLDNYQCFYGDVANYPPHTQWLPFDKLWMINHETILSNNGGDDYVDHWIHEGILQVAHQSGVDPRLILALVMQDSHGRAIGQCLRPEDKCGLLHVLSTSDYEQIQPAFDSLHPRDSIVYMLQAGIESARGYASYLSGSSSFDTARGGGDPWTAARKFNSGGVASDANLDYAPARGQSSYVNDVANRLLGWKGRGSGFELCRP